VENPRSLILETSGRVGQVALAEGNTILRSRLLDEGRRHARDLAPSVAALLAQLGWKPRELHLVVVNRGPGSYTGLRVGIMSAKTMAYATGAAIIAVEGLQAIASQAPGDVALIDVIADAQQDRIYHQSFRRETSGGAVSPTSELVIQPFAAWLTSRATSAWVSGPGLYRFRERLGETTRVIEATGWNPRPEALLAMSLARFRAGQTDNVVSLEPLYLRPSSAEEKWGRLSALPKTDGR
jgi:tRNA threonylcarbamoyladenosine biosynthesis protein TsaB